MAGYLVSYLKTASLEYVPWRVFTWHMNKLSSILEHRSSFVDLRVKLINLKFSLKQF